MTYHVNVKKLNSTKQFNKDRMHNVFHGGLAHSRYRLAVHYKPCQTSMIKRGWRRKIQLP